MSVQAKDSKHVLVVDDDDHTRTLLKDLCESTGYRVTTAEDGQEGLDRIAEGRPDLVLLDLMMPRRDGFSVLRTVRENTAWSDLPIILLTAMGIRSWPLSRVSLLTTLSVLTYVWGSVLWLRANWAGIL